MQKNNNEDVYISPSGKKYHIDPKCSYIRAKPIISVRYEVAKEKFGACSRCIGYNNPLLKNNHLNDNNNNNNAKSSMILNAQNLMQYKNFRAVYNSTNIISKNALSKTNEGIIESKGKTNVEEEVYKNNDINEEEQKDKISDFLIKSGAYP